MIELARKYNAKLSAIILDTPDYLDVSYAPEKLKQHAINVIENITPQNKTEKTFLRDCKNAIVRNTYDCGKSKYMIEVSKLKDEYKKQNFDLTEIAKYYG
jgi:predicted kinase